MIFSLYQLTINNKNKAVTEKGLVVFTTSTAACYRIPLSAVVSQVYETCPPSIDLYLNVDDDWSCYASKNN